MSAIAQRIWQRVESVYKPPPGATPLPLRALLALSVNLIGIRCVSFALLLSICFVLYLFLFLLCFLSVYSLSFCYCVCCECVTVMLAFVTHRKWSTLSCTFETQSFFFISFYVILLYSAGANSVFAYVGYLVTDLGLVKERRDGMPFMRDICLLNLILASILISNIKYIDMLAWIESKLKLVNMLDTSQERFLQDL